MSFLLVFSMDVHAETANAVEIKTKFDPGTLDKYSEKQLIKTKQNENKQEEEFDINNSIEGEAEDKFDKNKSYVRFELKSVDFSGNTVFTSKELQKYFDNLTNKEVGFNEIINAVYEITRVYQSMGYITSKAYIPPQKVSNGIIKINILEGKVGQIEINRTKWAKTSYIRNNFLKSNNVNEAQLLNINNIKSSLSDVNSKDYIKGSVELKRGKTPETTDIVLNVKDRVPLNFGATWDNLGRDYVGLQKAGIKISDRNLTGFGDNLGTNLSFTRGIFSNNVFYSLPLGAKGAELRLGYSHSIVRLGDELKSSKIKGTSNDFITTLSLPLFKNQNIKLSSDLTYDMLSSKLESPINNAYNNKYELRALRTGLNLLENDKSGKTFSRLEVSTGLPILGAKTEKVDASDATSKFVKIESYITRIQYLPWDSYCFLKISGQYSPFHLLSNEQTQYGGMYSVRGFREGVLYGDVGYNISVEARKAVPYLPKELKIPYRKDKVAKIPLKNRIYFAVFYDQALARELHQEVAYSYKNFLQSIGVGLNMALTKYLNANMYIGIPVGRQRNDRQNSVRYHFGISSDLI